MRWRPRQRQLPDRPSREGTKDALAHLLRHPDPAQLSARLAEIVDDRVYVRNGVELREGDTIFDVGANIGVAAAFFALECRVGVVHSFEPVRPIFELLRDNLRHFPACVPHGYGLSSESGDATITYYPDVSEMSGLYADPVADRANLRKAFLNLGASEEDVDEGLRGRFSATSLPCELRTVSEVIQAESVDRIDLLKIDVEKAELDVLSGIADQDWPRIHQIVAELHLPPSGREEAAKVIGSHGFDVTVTQDPIMSGTRIHMLYAVRPSGRA